MSELNNKIVIAAKWSSITEVVARLITPITSIILARLLTPEAFGIVTTLTMVITFAEIFTDAGFQKYLIQHEFKDEIDRVQSVNVAFWSNFIMSLLIWGLIVLFCDPLARIVGNPGLGYVLSIACISIPIAAFSSIQMALYKRELNFKTLFKIRIVGISIPLFVTVPLALLWGNYWALIIGTIISNIVNAILLTFYSNWKPKWFYSIAKLKEMFSFTVWSMIEAISIWLTTYVDIFIIGVYLNEHYLGLYKTSIVVVGQIMGLVTAATTPILFSSLSRLQDDEIAFTQLFLKFQKLVGLLVIPLGVGMFCFSDLVTELLLGNQWSDASYFIGLWGLTSALTIVLSHYSSEVYRAKGKPKLSVLSQFLHIIVLCPIIFITVKNGFDVLCTARALIRIESIFVNLVIMYILIHISSIKMFENIFPSCVSSMIMALFAYGLSLFGRSLLWQFFSIGVCIIVYFLLLICFANERSIILSFVAKIKNQLCHYSFVKRKLMDC